MPRTLNLRFHDGVMKGRERVERFNQRWVIDICTLHHTSDTTCSDTTGSTKEMRRNVTHIKVIVILIPDGVSDV